MISYTVVEGTTVTVQVDAEPGTLLGDLPVIGVGEARCRPGDLFVRATGERIAAGRAIQDFGRQVEEEGLNESVGLEEVDRVLVAVIGAFGSALVEVPTEDGATQHFDCPRCGRRYPVLRITTRGLELRDQLQVTSGVARRGPTPRGDEP